MCSSTKVMRLLYPVNLVCSQITSFYSQEVLPMDSANYLWCIREYLRQCDAADALDHIRSQRDVLFGKVRLSASVDRQCALQARALQSAIFNRRSSNPLIFDWFYKIRREGLEQQIYFDQATAELINIYIASWSETKMAGPSQFASSSTSRSTSRQPEGSVGRVNGCFGTT